MANAPAEAKYIVQQSNVSLPNAQSLDDLSIGLLKNTSSGVLEIASPTSDYMAYNLELASIAGLNPAQGDLLIGVSNESWTKLSMGTVGTVLMATVGGPTYEPIIPYNTSIITATVSAGTVPSSRVLLGGTGISIVDTPGVNAIFVATNGNLEQIANLNTSGILVNNAGTFYTRGIVSSVGSISITNPAGLAGNINLEVVDDTTYQQVKVLNNGSLVATRSQLNFIPGSNVGLTITDDGINNKTDIEISTNEPVVPAGVTWSVVSSSTAMVPATGYLVNGGALVSLSLPTSIAVGQMIRVGGMGSNPWRITQAASQQIIFGNMATTSGTGGSLTSTNSHDCIELVCVVTNTTFLALSSVGNITVV